MFKPVVVATLFLGVAQTCLAQTSLAQTSLAQTSPAQTNPAQTNPAEANPAQSGASGAGGQQSAQAIGDPATLAAAHRLMTVAHMDEAMNAMVQAMIPQMVQSLARVHGLTQSQVTMVSRIVREEMIADTPRLIEMMAQLYATRLTASDLNAAADFYQSDPGKHFVAVQAQLSAEAMAIGRAWGQQLTPRVVARIEAEERTPGGVQP